MRAIGGPIGADNRLVRGRPVGELLIGRRGREWNDGTEMRIGDLVVRVAAAVAIAPHAKHTCADPAANGKHKRAALITAHIAAHSSSAPFRRRPVGTATGGRPAVIARVRQRLIARLWRQSVDAQFRPSGSRR